MIFISKFLDAFDPRIDNRQIIESFDDEWMFLEWVNSGFMMGLWQPIILLVWNRADIQPIRSQKLLTACVIIVIVSKGGRDLSSAYHHRFCPSVTCSSPICFTNAHVLSLQPPFLPIHTRDCYFLSFFCSAFSSFAFFITIFHARPSFE